MRDDAFLLEDILEAIQKIGKYVRQGHEAFKQDELIQSWMVHHVQIIGEAARKLSEGLIAKYSDIPWNEIIGMRNILVHDYFGINPDEVWTTVSKDLPDLKQQVQDILKELKEKKD